MFFSERLSQKEECFSVWLSVVLVSEVIVISELGIGWLLVSVTRNSIEMHSLSSGRKIKFSQETPFGERGGSCIVTVWKPSLETVSDMGEDVMFLIR